MVMKVGVAGANGRVGQLLIQNIKLNPDLELAGKFDHGEDPVPVFEAADVVIDFTTPRASVVHAKIAADTKTALVVGTTGLSEDDEASLKEFSKNATIVYAANMSVGVNVLLALVEQVASKLDTDYDIEIYEAHHRHKVDSPSGTALALGKSAQAGRSGGEFVTDRAGKRKEGDIGFGVLRGGDIVGEHTVGFYGLGERIEITHKATDRVLFANGAIRAAQWTKGKSSGLYTMRDVLGL